MCFSRVNRHRYHDHKTRPMHQFKHISQSALALDIVVETSKHQIGNSFSAPATLAAGCSRVVILINSPVEDSN